MASGGGTCVGDVPAYNAGYRAGVALERGGGLRVTVRWD